MKLGKILRYYREQNGYTQEQVANLIHVSERTVGHYETDTRSPSVDTLSLLAEAYEMNITEFFKEIPEEKEELEKLDSVIKEELNRLTVAWKEFVKESCVM